MYYVVSKLHGCGQVIKSLDAICIGRDVPISNKFQIEFFINVICLSTRRVPANGKLYPMIRFSKKNKNCHEQCLLIYFEINFLDSKVDIQSTKKESSDDSTRVRANVISQHYLL